MGRLIDADALIAQIWEKHKKVEESYDLYLCVDELKEVLCGIVSLVDEQPIAYDPDKIVDQLNDKFRVVRTDEDLEWNRAMDEAITIVKGGGIDGN